MTRHNILNGISAGTAGSYPRKSLISLRRETCGNCGNYPRKSLILLAGAAGALPPILRIGRAPLEGDAPLSGKPAARGAHNDRA